MKPEMLAVVLLLGASGQAQETFTIQMPIRVADIGDHFVLNSFGSHIGNHALDGHPGWDVEYRIGATVLAAAGGVVQSLFADPQEGATTVQIQHSHGRQTFRTVYTNIREVDPAIVPGAPVAAGQPIGIPAARTQTIGNTTQTWAMTHFQLDDFTVNRGLSNTSAVSPEAHLNAAGRAVFDAMWPSAANSQEICEPFPSNSRNIEFPLTRTWTRQSGALAPRIDFTCIRVQADSYRYTLFDANGRTVESGGVFPQRLGPPFSILELKPDNGATRRAVLKIVSETMMMDLGAPGAAAPSDLSNASTYSTAPPPLSLASAASFAGTALAPDSIASAFGVGLAFETAAASSLPLPATLASTRVMVRDSAGVQRNAALYAASPGQVNFVVPAGTAAGAATVMVTSGDGPVFTRTVSMAPVSPGLFTANGAGTGLPAALVQRVRADGSQSTEAVAGPIDVGPADDQVFLILFGTGIRLRPDLSGVRVRAGGMEATVVYAGPQRDSPGLDQINVLLPRTLAGRGEAEVALTIEGIPANPVTISIR